MEYALKEMEEKQAKQEFLATEIITKGYDPEKFMDLLESKKPGQGTDVDFWTLAELQKCVREFQAQEAPVQEAGSLEESMAPGLIESSMRNLSRQSCRGNG